MFQKIIKYGFRGIWKNKLFSAVNLLGLTTGIAAFMVLFLYTLNEKSYDKHFKEASNIYRVSSMPLGIDNNRWARSLGMIHSAAASLPYVEDATWFSHAPEGTIKIGNRQYQQKDILSVDESFINLFEVKTVFGDLSEITAPNTAFISERFANKYFNGENPIGKTIEIDALQYQRNLGTFEIRGVVKNTHPKTHFNYEILLSQKGALSERYTALPGNKIQWVYNYLLLRKGTKPEEVAKALHEKFSESSLPLIAGPKEYKFSLIPLTDIHQNSNDSFELKESTSKVNIGLFTGVALVILLISLFNFTNLTIAQLIKRSQELVLKRSLGATTFQLIFQVLTEVFLTCLLAIMLALTSIEILKPMLNQLFEIDFEVYYREPSVYLSILLALATCLLISTLFTLLIIHKKSNTSKQQHPGSMAMRPLLIAQVAIVIVLISSTLLVNKQIRYVLTSPLGFDEEQVVVLHLKDFSKDPAVFANELKKQSEVESVGFSMQHFAYPTQSFQLEGLGLDGTVSMIFTNYDYLKTMKLQFVENWISTSADTVRGMVVNEHLYKRLIERHGNMDALKVYQANQPFEEGTMRINFIGVVKDFNYSSAHEPIGDFGFWLDESPNRARYIHIRLNPGNLHLTMNKIEKVWNENYPEQEFNYFFLDDQIAGQYKSETILSRILITFSLLAAIIATIGIGALSVFISQQRTKEIGIRKVNGAKVSEILSMLNSDFVKWVAIAFVIATPIAYYAMQKWLQNFAYKTTLSWWIFALAGVLALGIALFTVSLQSWRAATRNPVESLRYE
ncbi:MAG: ABC transporter permease [Prolixibacteraceae bacterium]|nr:ABC transporter permease [Prolixibacteraceae bacterium]